MLGKSKYLRTPGRSDCRSGFTLVEMLVSVALILVIMILFAEIFQIATASLSKQKGLAENDQRARLLTTTIRWDLKKRTFTNIIPLTSANVLTIPLEGRAGYFYYAENDPLSGIDDVLQFTVRFVRDDNITDSTRLIGKAVPITSSVTNQSTVQAIVSEDPSLKTFSIANDYSVALANLKHIWISGSRNTNGTISNDGRYVLATAPTFNSGTGRTDFTVDPSSIVTAMDPTAHGTIYISETQPDMDDGVAGNASGLSTTAEVSYFLRGTNLYRRVLLIRDSDTSSANVQPRYANGNQLIPTTYPTVNGTGQTFWNDFDYSAFYFRGYCDLDVAPPALTGYGPLFHSAGDSLNNAVNGPRNLAFAISTPPLPPPLRTQDGYRIISLGSPQVRFGHDPWTGLPREFAGAGVDGQLGTADDDTFIGRYTLQESSNAAFGYPGSATVPAPTDPGQDSSPMSMNTPYTLDSQKNVSTFSGSVQRRGEDILMTNVLSFDVKAWDPAVGTGKFVDLGDGSSPAFGPSQMQNTYYCPGSAQYRYDTWHPEAEAIQPGPAGAGTYLGDSDPPFAAQLTAIQITINYRDVSSGLVRQLTLVQSLMQ